LKKAVLKYIEHSILYEHITQTSKSEHFEQSSLNVIVSQEWLNRLNLSFLKTYLDEFYLAKTVSLKILSC
jgi:hypothetical protein